MFGPGTEAKYHTIYFHCCFGQAGGEEGERGEQLLLRFPDPFFHYGLLECYCEFSFSVFPTVSETYLTMELVSAVQNELGDTFLSPLLLLIINTLIF